MGEEPQAESPDERFGRNLRDLRDRQGVSQAELARQMAARGHPWHQSTVYRVEQGRQAVSFWESEALAGILGTSPSRFALAGQEASELEAVLLAGARLRERYEQAAQAVADLLDGHAKAAWVLSLTEGSKYERVQEAREDVGGRMDGYVVEEAVAEGIRRARREDGSDDGTAPDPQGQS